MQNINIETFLQKSEFIPIVDVRTPAEFANGHIPGANNIPLFSNEERAIVGTIYKQKGREQAILKGLEFVGIKLKEYVVNVKNIAPDKQILIHCWRGGMRSSSLAWLFETAGIKCFTLTGGYKSYRNYIKTQFSKPAQIIILGGMTGSGKTDILHKMIDKGEQVLDLEDIANHKGSSFGAIGQLPQLPNEQFENNIFEIWKTFDLKKTIWIEDESKNVGKNFIPNELFAQMRQAKVIKINIPKDERVKRLINEYASFDNSELLSAVTRIKKRIGGLNLKNATKALNNKDYEEFVNIVLSFYDNAYNYGLSKRDSSKIISIKLSGNNIDSYADSILRACTLLP